MVLSVRDRGIAWRRNEGAEKSEGQLPMFSAGLPSCASANLFVRKALFTWKRFFFFLTSIRVAVLFVARERESISRINSGSTVMGNSLWGRAVADHGPHIVTATLMPGFPDPLTKLGVK